jgi:hypothetical protein
MSLVMVHLNSEVSLLSLVNYEQLGSPYSSRHDEGSASPFAVTLLAYS